ncbi:vegetative incompatibility HET-E-1 [Fusarium albosuccineum]|uniref:Vegetative incompatibility HET-E-1 n=1 Tax=Fusarium albosuccineum TaxID=1237068 RepID=A0A8H4L245_9HYPO|nr:vegetative incompatibility HET-E-1 [Fusarium albosuccineum]
MDPPPIPFPTRSKPISLLHEKIDSLELRVSDGRSVGEAFIENIWPALKSDYEEMLPKLIKFCKTYIKVPATIEGRVKSCDSIRKTIDRRERYRIDHGNRPYSNTAEVFRDVHDLVGLRIVVDFTSHLDLINEFIKDAFWKRKEPNVFSSDRQVGHQWKPWFGAYQSWNHHVSIRPGTARILQPYRSVMFEVQLTCLSESLYNRLAHRLLYKGSPDSITKKDEMVIDLAHGMSLCYSMCLLFFEDRLDDPDLIDAMKQAAPSPDINDEDGNPTRLVEEVSKRATSNWNQGFAPGIPSFNVEREESLGKTIKVQDLLASLAPPQDQSNSTHNVWAQMDKSIRQVKPVYFISTQEAIEDAIRPNIQLPTVQSARFDSRDVRESPTCHRGTRVKLLNEIESWINDIQALPMLWLYAPAGTGKSTLARTLAIRCEHRDVLAAGYFFRRGDSGRNGTARLFPTIASQLVKQIPRFQIHLRDSVKSCSPEDIEHRHLEEQFKMLIYTPLPKLKNQELQPKVIIIEALDECDEHENLYMVIKLLSSLHGLKNMQMRMLFTSRHVNSIIHTFAELSYNGYAHYTLALHERFQAETKEDIKAFLTSQFAMIRMKKRIKRQWPRPEEVDLVVNPSTTPSPLFIYAATLIRFIDDARARKNPVSCLDRWIRQCQNNESQLDRIYMPILEEALIGSCDDDKETLLKILGSIACANRRLSAKGLCSLLHIHEDDMNHWLGNLHPVLHVPEDDFLPIEIIHKSFSDFLLGEGASRDKSFKVDVLDRHRQLAAACIERMSRMDRWGSPLGLCQDICKRRDPASEGLKDDDISLCLPSCIPDDLAYACNHWFSHWWEGQPRDDDDYIMVESFLEKHFLHWIEALSLLGESETGGIVISLLQSNFQPHLTQRFRFVEFLKDAESFLFGYGCVKAGLPLQIYSSALVFCAPHNQIKEKFFGTRLPFIQDVKGGLSHWFPRIPEVLTIDPRIELPPTPPDCCQQIITTDSDVGLRQVAISPDGEAMEAADEVGNLSSWDIGSRECRHILLNDYPIVGMSFSEDGKDIDLVFFDGKMRIWNTETGRFATRCMLQGREQFRHVAFSRRHSLVAASSPVGDGLDEQALGLWDFETGQKRGELQRDYRIMGMTLSADGKTLAVLTQDAKVDFWSTETKLLEQTRHLPEESVAIDYSRCGTWLATASRTRVYLWDIAKGISLAKTIISNQLVESMFFFPDANRLAACCINPQGNADTWHRRTISSLVIWDVSSCRKTTPDLIAQVATGSSHETFQSPGFIMAMALSPNKQTLATASSNHSLLLWDVESNTVILDLPMEATWTKAMDFSPDGTTLAVLTSDEVQLWEVDLRLQRGHLDKSWILPCEFYFEKMLFLKSSKGELSLGMTSKDEKKWCLDPVTGVFQKSSWDGDMVTASISVSDSWIQYTGPNASFRNLGLVKMPDEYTSARFTQAGNRLVMGIWDGNFLVLDFDLAKLEDYCRSLKEAPSRRSAPVRPIPQVPRRLRND